MTKYHFAKINIATALDDMETEVMAPFVAKLDEINELAETSPVFVLHLKDETGSPTSINAFNDPRLIINMSVWDGGKPLMDYVYKSAHTQVMAKRRVWFHMMKDAYHVLWWVEESKVPTMKEAKERLDHLKENGPSEYAFTCKKQFPISKAA